MVKVRRLGGLFVLLICVLPTVAGCWHVLSGSTSTTVASIEKAVLFHPVKAEESWTNPPSGRQVEDVWFRTSDGTRIHAWWLPRTGSRDAVLFCHGNAGNLSFWTPITTALLDALGQSVLIFDYPGYGRSKGEPSEPGCYAAADAAYDWLVVNQHIAPERITFFGESLGGGVACDLASRRTHRALILARTFTSIPDVARKGLVTSASASLVQSSFDNLSKIERCVGPVFIAHGDRDRLIPLALGQELYQRASQPKQFFLLTNCDHNDPYPAEFFAALARFLK